MPSHIGHPDSAFRYYNSVGFRNEPIDFGAQSSQPAFSLPTLRTQRFARWHGKARYQPARYGFGWAGFAPAGLH
jgi:hypothetical protein